MVAVLVGALVRFDESLDVLCPSREPSLRLASGELAGSLGCACCGAAEAVSGTRLSCGVGVCDAVDCVPGELEVIYGLGGGFDSALT